MSEELLRKARAGLEAWQRGDVGALEPLLAPEVELTWWEPSEWDCYGRDAVLAPKTFEKATILQALQAPLPGFEPGFPD